MFTLLDTVNERSHIESGDFAQANQIDLGVDSSGRYRHVSQVIAHLLQCQTLGQKVRGTSMTQHVRAISLKLQARASFVASESSWKERQPKRAGMVA